MVTEYSIPLVSVFLCLSINVEATGPANPATIVLPVQTAFNNGVFQVEVSIGAKNFSVGLDTAVPMLRVKANDCKNTGSGGDQCFPSPGFYQPHQPFRPKNLQRRGKEYKQKNGGFTTTGHFYTEPFSLTVNRHKFSMTKPIEFVALSETVNREKTSFGLSLPDPKQPGTSIVTELLKEKFISSPFVVLALSKCDSKANHCAGGFVTLGTDKDDKRCGKIIKWLPVVDGTHLWKVKATGLTIETHVLAQAIDVVSESTMKYIMLPEALFKIVVDKLKVINYGPGSLNYVDCKIEKFKLKISFENLPYIIDSEVLLDSSVGGGKCELLVAGHAHDYVSLGMPWLFKFCQLHDFRARKMGFAQMRSIRG